LERRALLTGPSVSQAVAVSFRTVEMVAYSGPVATFTTNARKTLPADFRATVDWGDGGVGAASIVKGTSRFTVSGKHTYKDFLDVHQVKITISAKVGGSHATVSSTPKTSGATFHVSPGSISATAGTSSGTITLGRFQILDPKVKASDLAVTVKYADGTTSGTATIVANPATRGAYKIIDTHTFTKATGTGGGTSLVSLVSRKKAGLGFTLKDPTLVKAPPLPPNTWTVLVYMEADNDLSAFAPMNLAQMERATSGLPGTVHYVVFLHQGPTAPITTGNGTQHLAGSSVAVIVPGGDDGLVHTVFTQDATLGAETTDKPKTLDDFIAWGAKAAPAQHYALIMWDHGASWAGLQFDTTPPTSHLSVTDFASALKSSPVHISVLALDLSLMQTAEVAFKVAPYVDTIVASEESPAGTGLPYDTLLSVLTTNPGQVDAFGLANGMVQANQARYGSQANWSQSATNDARFGAFADALKAFTTAADALAPGVLGPALLAAQGAATSFYYAYQHDLGQFMAAIAANTTVPASVRHAAQGVVDALKSLIIFKGNDSVSSTGMAIYLPARGTTIDPGYLFEYKNFFAATGWDVFLQRFF
jgi:hypothetical protein